ncbi:MAG: hypothetical protein JZU67_04095 [Burkholderiaceae bacterium]|jgi:DNA-directed RNA polymerase subunit RPC12/RpoP|nr:hypothetical protein [Burkholderiaceae bacterium]
MENIETAQVVRAYKAARFMKYGSAPISLLAILIAFILGGFIHVLIGVFFFLLSWAVLFISGYRNARCPSCGQVWWSWIALFFIVPWWIVATGLSEKTDELDSMKCRKCGLEIGPHLREL